MKIADTTCRLIKIWDMPQYFDVINASFNNTYPGAGRVTITADSSSWSYYWNAIGEDRTIEEFFSTSPVDYLIDKLGGGIRRRSDERDIDECVTAIRRALCKARRKNLCTSHFARLAWDELGSIEWFQDVYHEYELNGAYKANDILNGAIDVEWPEQKINPQYERLEYAINQTREAIKQLQEQANDKK